MSGSSRSRVLKAIGGAVTVVAAFALIGAGVQLARNVEGYEVQTAALDEIDGAPATVVDDAPASAAPAPPVVADDDAAVIPRPPSGGSAPPPNNPNPGGGGGGGGGGPDPTDPDVPPELEPIIGLVDDVTSATDETLGGSGTTSSGETVVDGVTGTVGETTPQLGL